ncbi:4078_t:CDS:1, partial [Paraglomus occultum]
MSTSQVRPPTPLSEYGPSLTPPTAEEINLRYLSVESSENTGPLLVRMSENAIATTETEEPDSDTCVSPCDLISVYLVLIVNATLMSAVIITLIQLIM